MQPPLMLRKRPATRQVIVLVLAMSFPLLVQSLLRVVLGAALPESIPLRWEGGAVVWAAPTDAAFWVGAAISGGGIAALVAELLRRRGPSDRIVGAAGVAASLPPVVWSGSAIIATLGTVPDAALTVVLVVAAVAGTLYGLIPRSVLAR